MTGKRTGDREAVDLLPIGAGLLISHQEVLVVDPSKVEAKIDAIYSSFEHQTGVTERSISSYDGTAGEGVVDDVMVRDITHWIGSGGVLDEHGENQFVGIELRVADS
jgi:hypothetical protein